MKREQLKKKKVFIGKIQDTFDATIKALQGKESKEDVIDIMYEPEHTDIVICPICKRKFNICKAYNEDEMCPHCGQHFNIDLWIS